MSDCSIKLEVGKKYVARNGNIVGPLTANTSSTRDIYPYQFGTFTYKIDGTWDEISSGYDLVREHVEPEPKVEKANDPVNNPSHYASGAVECIDAIQASMSVEAFRGYLRGNCFKYLWRHEHKGGVEDLRKAEWYLKRLLATFDADA